MDVWIVTEYTNDGDVFVAAAFKYERDAIVEARRLMEIESEGRKQKYYVSDNQRTLILLDNSYTVEVVRRLVRS